MFQYGLEENDGDDPEHHRGNTPHRLMGYYPNGEAAPPQIDHKAANMSLEEV